MESGNGFVQDHTNGCLEQSLGTDGLAPLNVNKENANVDNGVDSDQLDAEADLMEAEGIISSGVEGAEGAPEDQSSKKLGQNQCVRLKNGKKEKGQLGQNSSTTVSQSRRTALSKSLSFPSKSMVNDGSRRSSTETKKGKPDPKGALPLKQASLTSKPAMALNSGSLDATAYDSTASEVPQSVTPTAASQKKNVAASFAFRLDERAEKRKEFFQKLEEKIQAKEVEKTNLQAKSKESQEAEIKQLRKSLTFKATPMPSFYKEPGPQKVELKKIPTTRARSPKLGRHKAAGAPTENSALDNLPTRSLRTINDPGKSEGVTNGNMGTIATNKPLNKTLSKLPSRKSTVTKLPDAKVLGAKLKVSNSEHAAIKAKAAEAVENLEKGSEGTSEQQADMVNPDSGHSSYYEGQGEDNSLMAPSLPAAEVVSANEVPVQG